MQVMGWSSMSMLNRYQHVLDEMGREAVAKMGGAIFDVALADDEEYE
ncbi:hypothetical protein [Rothia nasimurium]|nr:hypothetical protein [Rothia nasimurium]